MCVLRVVCYSLNRFWVTPVKVVPSSEWDAQVNCCIFVAHPVVAVGWRRCPGHAALWSSRLLCTMVIVTPPGAGAVGNARKATLCCVHQQYVVDL